MHCMRTSYYIVCICLFVVIEFLNALVCMGVWMWAFISLYEPICYVCVCV